jgi:diguanylate cyclase (GGDEF)-like protein/PAS domain S-box-containing protein
LLLLVCAGGIASLVVFVVSALYPSTRLPASWILLSAGVALLMAAVILLRAGTATRTLAEQVARAEQSEERFRDLTELSSDWFWEQDTQFRMVHMSGGAFEKVGLQRGLYLGKRCWEAPAYGISDAQWDAYRRSLYAHKPFQDVTYQRPDVRGCLRWLSISGKPVFDRDGRFKGYRGTGKDITDRKNAELRLQVEQRFREILGQAHDLPAVMPELVNCYAGTLGWDYGAFWRFDGETLVREATWTSPDCTALATLLPHTLTFSRQQAVLLHRAIDRRDAQWCEDLLENAIPGLVSLASTTGFYSAFAFPLIAGERPLGAFEVASRFRRPADDALLALAHSFVHQLAQFHLRREAEQELHFLADHDPLTGLPNRKLFERNLSQALTRARRQERRLAVLFIDLDRFKEINDTLGHDVGDRLLQEASRRLADCVRMRDGVARLGGDEFVVTAENVHDDEEVHRLAAALVKNASAPYLIDVRELHLTASVGIAFYPSDGVDLRTLLKNADVALYRAKERGRDTFEVYSTRTDPHSVERLTLETQLAHALDRRQLELHFQPTVSIATGRVTSLEALLRWRHLERGIMQAEEFMPLAEASGLLVPIARWVLLEACRQNARWRDAGLGPPPVSVNIFARQLLRSGLADDIRDALTTASLAPEMLQLEISESIAIADANASLEVLAELKRLGVRLALDDFGASLASLAQLAHLPVDLVKIDIALVRRLPGHHDSAAIARALIALTHDLRRKVSAKGVEREEQLAFLRENGCDEYQGFLFSEALEAAQAEALLRRLPSREAAVS